MSVQNAHRKTNTLPKSLTAWGAENLAGWLDPFFFLVAKSLRVLPRVCEISAPMSRLLSPLLGTQAQMCLLCFFPTGVGNAFRAGKTQEAKWDEPHCSALLRKPPEVTKESQSPLWLPVLGSLLPATSESCSAWVKEMPLLR